jgi:RNA polymerase sigma-70 factor (ECF subfamily)
MDIEKDFTDIYNSHAQKVYRLCLGYASGDEQLAKEWQQNCFIKVWNNRQGFKGNSSISTWIYRIAVNTCLSDLRKPKKTMPLERVIVPDQIDEKNSENTSAQLKKKHQCIDQLNHQNKTLILMELEDIPQAEIAETTGLKHGTLRTRLSRIRQSLLKCITNEK